MEECLVIFLLDALLLLHEVHKTLPRVDRRYDRLTAIELCRARHIDVHALVAKGILLVRASVEDNLVYIN